MSEDTLPNIEITVAASTPSSTSATMEPTANNNNAKPKPKDLKNYLNRTCKTKDGGL